MSVQHPGGLAVTRLARPGVTSPSGSTPFSPSQLTGLQAWYKADAGTSTTTDGVAISQWNDQSANARHLAQATGTKQPLYKTAIQNGLPIVRFDGVDDALTYLAGAAFITGVGLTVYVVVTRRGNPTNGRFVSLSDGAASDWGNPQTAAALYDNGTTYATQRNVSDRANTTTRPAIGTFNQFTIQYDGTNNSIWQDGALKTQLTPSNGAFSVSQFGVGNSVPGSTDPGQPDMGELIIVGGASSTTERQNTEAYLKARWGTP